jgi:hypothetical protein
MARRAAPTGPLVRRSLVFLIHPSLGLPRSRPRAGGGWAGPPPEEGVGGGSSLPGTTKRSAPIGAPRLRSPHKSPSPGWGALVGGCGVLLGVQSRLRRRTRGGACSDRYTSRCPSGRRASSECDWRDGRAGEADHPAGPEAPTSRAACHQAERLARRARRRAVALCKATAAPSLRIHRAGARFTTAAQVAGRLVGLRLASPLTRRAPLPEGSATGSASLRVRPPRGQQRHPDELS